MAESLGEATQSVLPVMEVEVRYRTRHGNGKTLSVSTRRNTWWNEKRRKGDEGQLKRGRKRNSDRGVGGERLCQYKPPGRLRAVRPSERINLSLARLQQFPQFFQLSSISFFYLRPSRFTVSRRTGDIHLCYYASSLPFDSRRRRDVDRIRRFQASQVRRTIDTNDLLCNRRVFLYAVHRARTVWPAYPLLGSFIDPEYYTVYMACGNFILILL